MTLRKPHLRYEYLAVIIFLALSLPITYFGRGERSAWVLSLTSFPGSQSPFGLFGYNYILHDEPFMTENLLSISQILMFSGSREDIALDFTAPRAIYAFLASLWAPLLGVMGSQVFINWLAWAFAAYAGWWFTIGMFGDRLAALIAVVMVGGGLGFAIHIHDYSPHLVGFTVYYLGVLMIYESRVWTEPRALRIHLLLGMFLALASLTYTIGLALTLGYLCVAIWRNRWWHVALAAAVAFSSRSVYVAGLNVMQSYVTNNWQWVPIGAEESDRFSRSMAVWGTYLQTPPQFLAKAADGLAQSLLFEFPLIVVLGLLSWTMLPRTWAVWRFFVAFFAWPIAGGMSYMNYFPTRSYVLYGISLLLYVPLAAMLARGLRSSRPKVLVPAALALALVIPSQIAWSTGYLWGYIVPTKIFLVFGSLEWIPPYLCQFSRVPAFSMTGAEATPRMFGGGASLRDAGLFVADSVGAVTYAGSVAILSRVVILTYAALLAACAAKSWRTLAVSLGGLLLFLGAIPVVMAKSMPLTRPAVKSTFYTTVVPPNSTLRYTVSVSDAFVAQLRRYEDHDVTVQFMTSGIHPPFDVSVTDGRGIVLAESHEGGMLQNAKLTLSQVLRAVESSRSLAVLYATRDAAAGGQTFGTTIFGWQRNALTGRSLTNERTNAAWGGEMLPAFEMRVIDSVGRSVLIGF